MNIKTELNKLPKAKLIELILKTAMLDRFHDEGSWVIYTITKALDDNAENTRGIFDEPLDIDTEEVKSQLIQSANSHYAFLRKKHNELLTEIYGKHFRGIR